MISFKQYNNFSNLFETDLSINEDIALYKNSKGIKRIDMPQISSDNVSDFIKFLNDRGIKSKKEKIVVNKLKPTQKEFNPSKVGKLQTAPINVLNKTIIKSNDDYILDGHHRMSALLGLDAHAKMNVISVDLSIKELLAIAKEYPKTFYKGVE